MLMGAPAARGLPLPELATGCPDPGPEVLGCMLIAFRVGVDFSGTRSPALPAELLRACPFLTPVSSGASSSNVET